MKLSILPIAAGVAWCCLQHPVNAQQFQEHISKTFTLSKEAALSTLAIYNVNGPVRVEGYSGDNVVLEIDKTITAKDEAALNKGKDEFKVEFEQNADSIMAYIAAPFDSRPRHNWNRDGNDNRRQIEYSYRLEFTVKVPSALNLAVSTINGGEVSVYNVSGVLDAHNVNGPISLNNAKGLTNAATINGNLTIDYLSNPPGGSSYRTINGTIKVSYQADLSADLELRSMHGGYYTDFPDAEILPVVITKNQLDDGHGMVYRLNKNTAVRIGKGGKTFRFETLNGDIFIKKQS
jgi:hypothetical protein